MSWEWIMGTAVVLLVTLALWCLVRVGRESGRVRSTATALGVWSMYLLHLGILIATAVRSVWPISLPATVSAGVGAVLLTAGVTLTVLGMWKFRTVRRMSGRDTSQLITEGIYTWSRNPQNVGWITAQFGIALLGQSALALAMSTLFGAIFLVYVRQEERHLEAVFGDEYRAYLRRSHRIIGLPEPTRRLPQEASPQRTSAAKRRSSGKSRVLPPIRINSR